MTVRLHRDFVRSTLASDLPASGAGSTTLHSAGLTGVGAVSGGAVLAVSIDPEATLGPPEIVHVTSLTAGANSGVITRGQEGTSATHYPAGTPWVHALTAWDIDAVSGTGGGGIAFGPNPPPVTTTLADVSTGGSWWGGAGVIFMTWTPTRSGVVNLAPPGHDADLSERDYYIWPGTTANVSYPDLTDASASFAGPFLADAYIYPSGGVLLDFPATCRVVAGHTYTVAIVWWGTPPSDGHTITVRELYASLEPFGGIDPLVAPLVATPLGALPDGSLTVVPPFRDPSLASTADDLNGAWAIGTSNVATGQSSFAEGFGSHATGNHAHAEGLNSVASGVNSHAEGLGSQASGDNAHAEGWNAHADGLASHAEATATAAGDYSHAQGLGGNAQRYAEHAQGAGSVTDGFSHAHATHACRVLWTLHTTNATPTKMLAPNGIDHLAKAGVTAMSGLVVARSSSAGGSQASGDALVKAWRISGLVYEWAGAGVLVGAPTPDVIAETGGATAAWDVALSFNGSTGAILVEATGGTTDDVTWSCFLDLIEGG